MRNHSNYTGLKISALALAVTMAAGCGVELEGDEGNLSFNYAESEWRATASSGDLAKGASVDVYLTDARNDSSEPLELIEAYSDDAQTLDVTDEQSHEFQLTAHEQTPAEGTRIHAEAYDEDGDELSDSVSIVASTVDSVEFDTTCAEPLYVTNSSAEFQYKMEDSLGNLLNGYGYYPVDVEPAAGGEIDEDHRILQTVRVSTGDEAGEFELVAGEDVSGDPMDFGLIEPADIDELDINTDTEDTKATVEVGQKDSVAMFGLGADDDSVCGGADGAVDITTTTPDVCEPDYSFFGGLHFVQIEGLEAGSCELNLSVVDTDLEQSLTAQVE